MPIVTKFLLASFFMVVVTLGTPIGWVTVAACTQYLRNKLSCHMLALSLTCVAVIAMGTVASIDDEPPSTIVPVISFIFALLGAGVGSLRTIWGVQPTWRALLAGILVPPSVAAAVVVGMVTLSEQFSWLGVR